MSVVDQDRPSTWIPFRSGLCVSCAAVCCRLPLEVRASDLLRLGLATADEVESPKRLAKKLVREGIVKSYRSSTGLFLLGQRSNGDCKFLGEDRLCTVYNLRPDTCRGFPLELGPRISYCPYRRR